MRRTASWRGRLHDALVMSRNYFLRLWNFSKARSAMQEIRFQ